MFSKTNTFNFIYPLAFLILFHLHIKAQSNSPSNVMDSTVVNKEIFFDIHAYDEATGLPLENAAADISGKLFDGDIYTGFDTEGFYTFEGPIVTDVNGDFSGSMIIPVFEKISTGIHDKQQLAPSGYALSNNWPEPFVNHSSFEVLSKEREFADLVVYDVLGQEVYRKKGVDLFRGVNTFSFVGLDELPSGFYLFTAEGDGFVMVEKGMKIYTNGFSGISSSKKSYSLSKDYYGIGVERVSFEPYNSSKFRANKSTARNLEQEIKSERSVEDVLSKQGVYSSVADDPPFYGKVYDTLGVSWIKNPGYWADVFQGIPLYGVTKGADTIFVDLGGTFVNKYIYTPGLNGVDTVKKFYDSNPDIFIGQVILYGKGDGSVVDSLDFLLPFQKK